MGNYKWTEGLGFAFKLTVTNNIAYQSLATSGGGHAIYGSSI